MVLWHGYFQDTDNAAMSLGYFLIFCTCFWIWLIWCRMWHTNHLNKRFNLLLCKVCLCLNSNSEVCLAELGLLLTHFSYPPLAHPPFAPNSFPTLALTSRPHLLPPVLAPPFCLHLSPLPLSPTSHTHQKKINTTVHRYLVKHCSHTRVSHYIITHNNSATEMKIHKQMQYKNMKWNDHHLTDFQCSNLLVGQRLLPHYKHVV